MSIRNALWISHTKIILDRLHQIVTAYAECVFACEYNMSFVVLKGIIYDVLLYSYSSWQMLFSMAFV